MKIIRNKTTRQVVMQVGDDCTIVISKDRAIVDGTKILHGISQNEYDVIGGVEEISPFEPGSYTYVHGAGWGLSVLNDTTKQMMKNRITAMRKIKAYGGINVGGNVIDTDIVSQSTISGALISLEKGTNGNFNFPTSIEWKTKDGKFVTLNYAAMESVAASVTLHIEMCFSAENAHHMAIDAIVDVDSANNYDYNTGWPL